MTRELEFESHVSNMGDEKRVIVIPKALHPEVDKFTDKILVLIKELKKK